MRAALLDETSTHSMIPPDKYNMAYAIFYLNGIAQLYPWNAFITAASYYAQRFCGTARQHDFENFFSLTFMASNLLFQALLVRHAKAAAQHSLTRRIVLPLALLLALFAATAALVLVKDLPREFLFAFTAICVALCGLCTSLLQAAIFGYAAAFPPKYTQAMMAGQGLAGLIVASAGLVTAVISRANNVCVGVLSEAGLDGQGGGEEGDPEAVCAGYKEVDLSAFAYFGTAVLILGVCIISFLFLERMPLTQYYTSSSKIFTAGAEAGAAGAAGAAAAAMGRVEGVQARAAMASKSGTSSSTSSDNMSSSGENPEETGIGASPMVLHAALRGDEELGERGREGEEEEEEEEEEEGEEEDSDDEGSVETLVGILPALDPCAALPHLEPSSPLLMAVGGVGGRELEKSVGRKHQSNVPVFLLDSTTEPSGHHSHRYHGHHPHQHVSFLALLRRLGSPGVAVFLVFCVTLALFPSTTVHIVSVSRCESNSVFFNQAFVPFQFVLFNLGDWGGRTLAGHLSSRFLLPPHRLGLYAAARVIFFPLFLLCNVEGSVFPVVFAADWWPTLFMVVFSLSNGYLSSLAMMTGPAQLPRALAERGGNVMVLLMTGGLSAGSLFSFVVSAVSLGRKV